MPETWKVQRRKFAHRMIRVMRSTIPQPPMPETMRKTHPLLWLLRYFREAKEELEKVTWPSRKDTVRYTVLVIGISILLAVIIAGLDWGFALGLETIVRAVK